MLKPPTAERLRAAEKAAASALAKGIPATVAAPEQIVGEGIGCRLSLAGRAAVLHFGGPMMNDPLYAWWYGGTCDAHLVELLEAARESAAEVVLVVANSPGGTVAGSDDVNTAARRLAESGKVVATVAHHCLASKAYWFACSLRRENEKARIFATPDAIVGSVGAMTTLTDVRKCYEEMGITVRNVTSHAMKDAGDPHRGIDEDVLGDAQERVDAVAAEFVRAVAAATGLTEKDVNATNARVFSGKAAEKAGLVSRCAGFAGVVVEAAEGAASWTATTVSQPEDRPDEQPDAGNDDEHDDEHEDNPMDLKTLRTSHADLVAQIEAEAAQRHAAATAEKPATVAELRAAFPGADSFVLDCLAQNLTLSAAKMKHYEAIKAENASLRAEAETARVAADKVKVELSGYSNGRDPLRIAPSAGNTGQTDKAAAFVAKVREHEKAGLPANKAIAKASAQDPEGHRAFVAAQRPMSAY